MRRTPVCSLVPVLSLLFMLATASSSAGQSPEKVMEMMQELGVEFVGVATDIPDRQNLGSRSTPRGIVIYAWDVETTADDRVADEYLLSVEHLRAAGIPAIHGSAPEFEQGVFGGDRYRLGGILTAIDIRGDARYEVKLNLDWQLYDTQSSAVVWEGSSSSMKRGASLGTRGEADNVLLKTTLGALESVLKKNVPDAVEGR